MSVSSAYTTAIMVDTPSVYFRLDETSGTTVYDFTQHGHTGTINGTKTFGVAGALTSDSDTAMGFNGTSTNIQGTVTTLGSEYSLEAWIKSSSSAEQHFIDIEPQQFMLSGGQLIFGTAGDYLSSPKYTYADGRYHHVVATYDGATKKIYVDSALVVSKADASSALTATTLHVGHFYGGGYLFSGSLDEVAVYYHALTATQVTAHYNAAKSGAPTPAPSSTAVPNHVMTADYVATNGGTTKAASTLAPWLNWASTSWQENPDVKAAGIKAMFYTDPNRQQPGDPMYTSDETTFAHTCGGSRIKSTYITSQYLMSPASSSMRTQWKNYVAEESDGATWDAIFEDDTNDVLYTTATPCDYSAPSWLSSSQGQDSSLSPTPIIYNGLQIDDQMALNSSSNVLGGMYEGCYSDSTTYPKIWDDPYWLNMENTELAMAKAGKLFICLGRDTTSASSAVDARLYVYASFLLTWAQTSSILWESYGTSSAFNVLPEVKLVAMNPLVAAPTDVSSLKTSGGVYAREYANCYIYGTAVGACATVVNPDRYNSHSYPYGTKYKHTLTLSGSSVIDGGTVTATGAAPPTTLSALKGVVVFL